MEGGDGRGNGQGRGREGAREGKPGPVLEDVPGGATSAGAWALGSLGRSGPAACWRGHAAPCRCKSPLRPNAAETDLGRRFSTRQIRTLRASHRVNMQMCRTVCVYHAMLYHLSYDIPYNIILYN